MKAMGASRIIVVGRFRNRLERARQIGADAVFSTLDGDPLEFVRSQTEGRGADVVIEAAGSSATWSQAMLMTRKGGTVIQFSGLSSGAQVSFDAAHLHYDEITMKGVFHTTPHKVELAAQMLGDGSVNVKPILDGEVPLSKVEDGLFRMQRSEVIKLAVVPSMSEY